MDLALFLVSNAKLGLLLMNVRMSPMLTSLRRCCCWEYAGLLLEPAVLWAVELDIVRLPRVVLFTTTEAANETLLVVGSLILRDLLGALFHGREMVSIPFER